MKNGNSPFEWIQKGEHVSWSRLGVFARIFSALTGKTGAPGELMIDSTHLKAHRTAASLLKKGGAARRIGRTRGSLNSKLHAVCDGGGRPVAMLLTKASHERTYASRSTRYPQDMPFWGRSRLFGMSPNVRAVE